MSHQDPIQRRKLYQEVLDRLTARIVAGEFGPNDQLPSERELMESYGVGRPAVREALQHLERTGIVAITHGERARIVVPTPETLVAQIAGGARHLLSMQPDSLGHLKGARLFFETGMARLAVEHVDEAALTELRRLVEAQRRAVADPEEVRPLRYVLPSPDIGDERQSDLPGHHRGNVSLAWRILPVAGPCSRRRTTDAG